MNDKAFFRFSTIISILNISIFLLLGIHLSREGVKGNELIIIVQIILFIITVYAALIFKQMNKLFRKVYYKFKEAETISDIIMKKGPTGIIVLTAEGNIEYINPIVEKMLNHMNPIGYNVLNIERIKNTTLYDAILDAANGTSSKIRNEHILLEDLNLDLYVNLSIYPKKKFKTKEVDKIIVMYHDVTDEINLKTKIETTYLSTIEALAKLVDAKDSYTGEHSKNVLNYVSLLCGSLNLDPFEIEKIKIAANFHDIGKIGVSDFILNKPAKLTTEEYQVMKKHCETGADIIKNIKDFEEISQIIRHHHERWDGNGYPDGIIGDDIPYGSQIIAIADTYDAIISDRVYRKGRSKDAALDILRMEKGSQFNPELVDLFVDKVKLIS